MIVRNVESGWEIIYQSAHALLAGHIATQLRELPAVPFWAETLAAIVDHDDHKEAFGHNVYVTDLGAPKDFTQFKFTAKERYEEVHRRIESGFRKHRWVGLLAARHAEELYREERVSKRLTALLDQEQKRRVSLLRDLSVSVEALESAYSVVQWCDRLSLILCQGAIPAMHRCLEIAPLAGTSHEIRERENGSLEVRPWPFRSEEFSTHVEVRTLRQLQFENDRELERCLNQSEVEARRWTFRNDRQTPH